MVKKVCRRYAVDGFFLMDVIVNKVKSLGRPTKGTISHQLRG